MPNSIPYSENISRLETLITAKKDTTLYYKGGTEGHPLYFGNDAAVQRSFLPAGTKFESHSHGSTEVVIVLSGEFFSTMALVTVQTIVAGVIVFPPGVEHSHLAKTDCWVIGVLIPSEVGYPTGQ